jgi:hypothetical protein
MSAARIPRFRQFRHRSARATSAVTPRSPQALSDHALEKAVWLNYLRVSHLITGDENSVNLTPAGVAFTEFVMELGETKDTRPW